MKTNLKYFLIFNLLLLTSCGFNTDNNLETDQQEDWIKTKESTVYDGRSNTPPFNHKRYKKYRKSYTRLWKKVSIRSNKKSKVDWHVDKILKNQSRYKSISNALGGKVPWIFIAIVHGMETSYSFSKHLHNGDSLCKKTWRVPAGRPHFAPTGKNGCYTFEESAKDAIVYEKIDRWTGWNRIDVWGYGFEKYNGFGYRNTRINIPSPYLWSYSNHYSKGKYCRDSVYCPNVVSSQAGAMTILKRFVEKGYNPFTGNIANSNQGNGSNRVFVSQHPDIGQSCYALNPSTLDGKNVIPARTTPKNEGAANIKTTLKPGDIFSPFAVTSDGNWYNVAFKLNGTTYGPNNHAWIYKSQVDCNGFLNKTCYAETIAGESIFVRESPNPDANIKMKLKPNAIINVKRASANKLWYEVEFRLEGLKKGWVYKDQINCSGFKQEFTKHRCTVKNMTGEDIRLRSALGVNSPIIEVLNPGDVVFTLLKLSGWFAVETKLNGITYGVTHGNPSFIFSEQLDKCQPVN